MSNKKVYRAGLVPYFIEDDGTVEMLFMKPSDAEYGGTRFQIAKGKVEDGESNFEAAVREAKEELGFFTGNADGEIEEVGNFLGRTMIYAVKVKDKTMFGLPHFETEETRWMSFDQFMKEGRDLHRPVIQAVMRKIRK